MSTASTPATVPLACLINVLQADAGHEALPGALDALAELGYSHVVLPPLDPGKTESAIINRLFAERSMSPITIFGGHSIEANVASADEAERAAAGANMRAVIDLTVALGGQQMNGVPYGVFGKPGAPTSPEELERAAREVGKAANYAHERGVSMTFEVLNRYETSVVNTAVQAVAFAELSESEHLKIHLDSFHMAIEEADMLAAISLALPKLGYLELGQSGRGSLLSGSVDAAAVVRHAVSIGYTGPIGVEAFSRGIIPEFVADALAIWREPYTSGLELAADAAELVRGAIR